MDAQQRRLACLRQRRVCLRKPDMRRQYGKPDFTVDMIVLVEDWCAKPAKPEPAAAFPSDRLRNPALFAVHDLHQPRHAMRHGMFPQLNPYPAPPFGRASLFLCRSVFNQPLLIPSNQLFRTYRQIIQVPLATRKQHMCSPRLMPHRSVTVLAIHVSRSVPVATSIVVS